MVAEENPRADVPTTPATRPPERAHSRDTRASAPPSERLDAARLRGLIATNLGASVAFASMYSTQPVLPQIGRDFHVDAATAGLTMLAVTFALALASLSAGRIADRLGSRRVMVTCGIALFVLSVLAAFAPTFPILVGIRAAQGLVVPGIIVSGLAFLHNDLPASWRGRVSGVYIATNTIGGLVGRLGVGLLVEAITWRGGLLFVAGVVALGTIILIVGMPRTPAGAHSAQASASEQAEPAHVPVRTIAARLWWAPLIGGTVFFPFLCVFTFMPYRLEGAPFNFSPAHANLFYLVYILGAGASLASGQISDRIGRRPTIHVALFLTAIGLALSLLSVFVAALAALAIIAIGSLAAHATANASVSDGANDLGPRARATALSLYSTGFYIGGGLGAFVPGFGWENFGWPGVVAPCALAVVCAAVVALKTPTRRLHQPAPIETPAVP